MIDLDGHSFWAGVLAAVLMLVLTTTVAAVAYEGGRAAGLAECETAVRNINP